jgi:multiple sugar transport system substrate-binding protein
MNNSITKVFVVMFLLCSLTMIWGGAQSEKGAAEKPVTLKVLRMGTQEVWVSFTRDFIARFEKRNPNVTVDYEYCPSPDLPKKFTTAIAGGTIPDVVGGSIKYVAMYAAKEQYMPLDDYFAKWDNFDDVAKNMLKVSFYDGKHYALAYHPDPYVYAYRKDYFAEAGLDPGNAPDTWAELAAAAPKLTKRDGDIVTRSGYLMPVDDNLTFIPMAVMNGAQFLDENKRPTFNGPQWIEALEFMTSLRKQKISTDTRMKQEWSSSTFAKGNAAIAQVSSAMLAQLFDAYPADKDQVAYFQLHKDEKTTKTSNWNGAWLYSIASGSKNKDLAWKFIEEWMSPEEVWACYEATQNVPVLNSLRDKFTDVNPELNAALFKGVETGLGNPLVTWATQQIVMIRKAMGEAYYGEKTPAQALEDNYQLLLEEIKKAQ